MKSPSRFDGKPIGTPMDAKSPFHAGVTMGPDQVERMERVRKLRNRALKAAHKSAREAAFAAIPEEERRQSRSEYKHRRNRADKMIRAMRNGTPVRSVANYYGLTPDDVLSEVKWLSQQRRRRDKGVPELPAHPKEQMSKSKRRRLRLRAKQKASREANAKHAAAEAQ